MTPNVPCRGQTRPTSLQTEAESYFSLAISSGMALPVLPGFNFAPGNDTHAAEVKHNKVFANAEEIMGTNKVGTGAQANAGVAVAKGLPGVRMTTENFAMDSFENLLFSVARFREYTGKYPLRITVVGYGMKKSRFEELHAKAIRWPVKGYHGGQRRFHYFGIDDEGDNKSQYEGEKIKGYRLFERDMYGCHGILQVSNSHLGIFIECNANHFVISPSPCRRSARHGILLEDFTVTLMERQNWQIY